MKLSKDSDFNRDVT